MQLRVLLLLLTLSQICGCCRCPRSAQVTPGAQPSRVSATSRTHHASPPRPKPVFSRQRGVVLGTASGTASYYADHLHGRPTASGALYDRYQFTAAHYSLPFGSRVRVIHWQTGRSVEVVINDRIGHRKRIIDLSYAAAAQIDMVRQGIANVQLELLYLAPDPNFRR